MKGVKNLFTVAVVAVLICITPLALANRARFWWQELIVNYALLLLIPSILAFCYLCSQRLTGCIGLLIKLIAAIFTVYHILFVGKLLYPYSSMAFDGSVSSADALTRFSIGYIERFSSWSEVRLFIERNTPDILIVQDFPRSQESVVPKVFGEQYTIFEGNHLGILVVSQHPIVDVVYSNLGILSHAGGVIRVKIAEGIEPLLGVMALEPSKSADIFERNRVTSRRMASILRNTPGYRLAFLRIASSPFSQFAYVFQQQTDMKSLLYNIGLWDYIRLGKQYGFGTLHNMYHSPDMNCVTTREQTLSESKWLCVCSVDVETAS